MINRNAPQEQFAELEKIDYIYYNLNVQSTNLGELEHEI